MKKNDKGINIFLVILVFVVFAISMLFITYYIMYMTPNNSKYFEKYNIKINNELASILSHQSEVDENIKEILKEKYSFSEPYIIKNPYGLNELSALIIFDTEEKTSINLYINSEFLTTVEASNQHVIPIYNLYANATNIVVLEKENGERKELEIKTDSYNDNLYGYNVKNLIKDDKNLLIVGDLKSKESNVRMFDKYNNLIMYFNLHYISGVELYANKMSMSYNSKPSFSNKLRDIKIDVDYLGKITTVSDAGKVIKKDANLDIGDKSYYYQNINLYKSTTPNYKIIGTYNSGEYTRYESVSSSTVDNELTNAEVYKKDYHISLNGEYLSYDFDEENAYLLVVFKNNSKIQKYKLEDNVIKFNQTNDASLFIEVDGKYYTLMTTLVK